MRKEFEFNTAENQNYLHQDANRQIEFFRASLRTDGGFDALDKNGAPIAGPQELHTTTRLIHSYALAKMAGYENCDPIIQAGLDALSAGHKDPEFGGYYWSIENGRAVDDQKLAYGHVFVLLAASSALVAGFDEARAIFDHADEIITRYFWDEKYGLLRDEFARDWTPFSSYRGMNANMHGVEAMLAAYECSENPVFLERAERILEFFTGKIAPQFAWRIPEHYDDNWQVDVKYEGNPMFRPRGTTPGHSFEFGRLILQYWDLAGRPEGEWLARAHALISTAFEDAWDKTRGGFVYTLDLEGKPDKKMRYWWPVTEAIGAVSSWLKIEKDEKFSIYYSQCLEFADQYLIDHEKGGWFAEIDDQNNVTERQFVGKPDIYHALQADFIPYTPSLSRLLQNLPKWGKEA